ncbi:hypothetical protein SeLEV6574_g02187 [Synchytrium endobioticum]|uniref:Uncharacterized protein n=1 Tax=Synchytrium endobioticum TaxID=286115 RepID=A0A507D9V5_9FUNG|nr:hypothetical protein SeLEV6574_g02187 [Synchytrium endobioticum]
MAIHTIYQDLLAWDNTDCSGIYGALSVIPSLDTSIAISIPGSANNTKSNTMPITHFPLPSSLPPALQAEFKQLYIDNHLPELRSTANTVAIDPNKQDIFLSIARIETVTATFGTRRTSGPRKRKAATTVSREKPTCWNRDQLSSCNMLRIIERMLAGLGRPGVFRRTDQ